MYSVTNFLADVISINYIESIKIVFLMKYSLQTIFSSSKSKNETSSMRTFITARRLCQRDKIKKNIKT